MVLFGDDLDNYNLNKPVYLSQPSGLIKKKKKKKTLSLGSSSFLVTHL